VSEKFLYSVNSHVEHTFNERLLLLRVLEEVVRNAVRDAVRSAASDALIWSAVMVCMVL
jgi:hypothetical protein